MTEGGPLTGGPLFGLPLAEVWFGLLFFVLATFLFLDGFDFGVGALFGTRDDEAERETLLAAIGPFWDGNEVWLVVFGGTLFAAFPAVYANLFGRHYLLTFGILAALIARGLAPEMYEQREDDRWQRWWGRAFVGGSVAAPFFLGLFVGNWLVGATTAVTLPGVLVGLTLVALVVVDGVAFLRVKTRGDLRADLRATGYRALAAYLVSLVVTLAAIAVTTPLGSAMASPSVAALVAATLTLAALHAAATARDRRYLAFGSAGGLVYALVAVVAVLLYPQIDPAVGLTVDDAIVSTLPLNMMTVGTALLFPLIFAYFAVLYDSFSGTVEAGEGY
jgi:cytochrome d ubiquinol oxidase subunit II